MCVGAEFGPAYVLLIERNLNMKNEIKKGKPPVWRQGKSMPVILQVFSNIHRSTPHLLMTGCVILCQIPFS